MSTDKNKLLNNTSFDDFINDKDKSSNSFDPNTVNLNDNGRQSNPIYTAIGYPSKIFYPNIQQYIRSFTLENAVVLDSFCGSGTTGIAALLENRKVILVDNSPQAINLSYNTLNPLNLNLVKSTFKELKQDLKGLINAIYKTQTKDGKDGYAELIMTSNIYTCPSCNHHIVLYNSATGVRSEYKCSSCGFIINISKKDCKERLVERRVPVEVTIKITDKTSSKKSEKRVITENDLHLWEETLLDYEQRYGHLWSPDEKIVYNRCYPRSGGWPGFPIDSSVCDLFPKGNLIALKILYNYISNNILDSDIKSFFLFVFTESLFRTSKRLFSTSGIKNVYHVPPLGREQNVFNVFERKFNSLIQAKQFINDQIKAEKIYSNLRILKLNSRNLPLKDNSVDYAFIDPPYGGMVPYAELNLFYSAWLKEKEDFENEVIIPMDFEKKPEFVKLWGTMLEESFKEVHRVLRPGSYFTIVFQSKFSSIWNELRDLMSNRIGFEFVDICANNRSTTFHTNQLNDTNPESAFITYRKATSTQNMRFGEISNESVFSVYPKSNLITGKSFREIQSDIIYLVHQNGLKSIPSDKEISEWLGSICSYGNDIYKIK